MVSLNLQDMQDYLRKVIELGLKVYITPEREIQRVIWDLESRGFNRKGVPLMFDVIVLMKGKEVHRILEVIGYDSVTKEILMNTLLTHTNHSLLESSQHLDGKVRS